MKDFEYRTLSFEIRSATQDGDQPQGMVKGYASTWAKDAFGDRVNPGAFGSSITEQRGKYPVLQGHDTSQFPIGFTTSLVEDHKGLLMEAQLALNTTAGRDAFGLLQTAKAVDYRMGLSIGFICREWQMEDEVRVLTNIDLKEISLTAFPANHRSRVLDARSIHGGEGASVPKTPADQLRAAIWQARIRLIHEMEKTR